MKKLFLLLSLVSIVFASCSSDDSADSDAELTTNGYLFKKGVFADDDGNISIQECFYNGDKITKIELSSGSRYEFFYTGNLITQTVWYANNVLNTTENYYYNSEGKMITRKVFIHASNICRRGEYTYNSDGTVNTVLYSGDFTTQNDLISQRKVFFLPNGDVEKIENYVVVNGTNHTRTASYTYDTMNAVSNVILGLNKVKKWEEGVNSGNSHNTISEISTTTENSSATVSNFSFTYNSYNFPVTSNSMLGTVSFGSSQFFYQQP